MRAPPSLAVDRTDGVEPVGSCAVVACRGSIACVWGTDRPPRAVGGSRPCDHVSGFRQANLTNARIFRAASANGKRNTSGDRIRARWALGATSALLAIVAVPARAK